MQQCQMIASQHLTSKEAHAIDAIERVTETADEISAGLEMMVYRACNRATPLSLSSMNQQSLVCPLP